MKANYILKILNEACFFNVFCTTMQKMIKLKKHKSKKNLKKLLTKSADYDIL